MYDIDIKLIKRGRRFFYIFLAAGVFFATIIGGIPLFNTIHKNKLDSSTTSTNVEIHEHRDSDGDTMYSPAYYYKVDGQEYICTSNSSSNIRPNTDNQTIYYDSKNPSDCASEYTQSSSLFFLILLILPAIFIIIAVINIHKINQRAKRVEQLNLFDKPEYHDCRDKNRHKQIHFMTSPCSKALRASDQPSARPRSLSKHTAKCRTEPCSRSSVWELRP